MTAQSPAGARAHDPSERHDLEPLEDAQARVLAAVSALPPSTVAIADALGLVLAEPVVAGEAVPPFANTAMDGYAVRAADTADASGSAPATLAVVAELRAGAAPDRAVGPGEAIRIMTGAPMPEGADAIVPVEVTERAGDDGVRILAAARAGDHVRDAGGDLHAGDEVFAAGTALGPAHLGVLASLGVASVSVHPRPRVAVLSTGDELVERGDLSPGKIRDSNRPLLRALVAEAGAEAVDLGIARDDEAEVRARISEAVDTCDALVTSGGVSVGDYDFVKLVIEQLVTERGGAFRWSQVAIKPAKPFAFGSIGGVPVFGLPGNPVSSHVSFELFGRPALRKMAGHHVLHRPTVRASAGADFPRRPDGKLHLDRVRVTLGPDGYEAARSGAQASNVLSGMASANGLALLADGEGVRAGGALSVMLLADPIPA
jgi:molybdenum cofactor synthesis domain-containing protein